MATEQEAILEVKRLEVVYHRSAVAVQGVSLSVPRGSIVALLGVNGAGKTTTLRAISGFLGLDNAEITDGSVEFEGEHLERKPAYVIARKGLILVPERQKIFETLTVKENLQAVGTGLVSKGLLAQTLDYFPVLANRYNKVAGYLSGGERQMLALSKALLCRPKLLTVDEFSLGLAPIVVEEIAQILANFRKDMGLTILIVEQNASLALAIADYGYVMETGHVVYHGTPEQLTANENVKETYLGTGKRGAKSYRDVKQYRRVRRWWC